MCTNPNLIRVIQLDEKTLDLLPRLKRLNWKINVDEGRAYKMVPRSSRDLPLEEIPEYINQDLIEVGCGNCIECRLEYSKQWAERCYLESLFYDHNYFITLTYDDEHVHYGPTGNKTIDKDDIRLFIKNVRQRMQRDFDFYGVRYFGCCEYGDSTFRPHAHIIMFNLPLNDLTIDFKDKEGNITRHRNNMDNGWYLYSQFIQDCWDKGNILIADCNFNTASYVSRYVLKKQKGKNQSIYTKDFGVLPPYLFMSNRPGIASNFFELNIDSLKEDPHLYIARQNTSPLITSLPRSFKKKLKVIDPSWYEGFTEKSKENISKARSLIKGITTINKNRSNIESSNISKSKAFIRDF